MIAGLPWGAWLLLVAAVGTGLTIELVHYSRQRRRRRAAGRDAAASASRPDER